MHLTPSRQSVITPQPISLGLGTERAPHFYAPEPSSRLVLVVAGQQATAQPAGELAPPAHTLAGDAWKGLVFSLLAGNRVDEAFQEIARIPPDIRRELDADVEFVQGEASLYAASGDIPRATEFMNKVENYYLLRRSLPPAGMEVQSAWLRYNTGNDHALYSILRGLDNRRDLTSEQREQVQTIWANWSMRRAQTAMDDGNPQLGLEILDAAAQNYPDNMSIRRAIAGGYLKVGRVGDSLAAFKAIPMQDAGSGDYQGAIGAALTAGDLVQAEAWLRIALGRFPADAGVLAVAARFEQAKGNNQRATDYWRASLAAMPPNSATRRYTSAPGYAGTDSGDRHATSPGDLKRLLDPDIQPQGNTKSSALPGSGPHSLNDSSDLPLPGAAPASSSAQTWTIRNAPVYVAKPGADGSIPGGPAFVQQSATQSAVFRLVSSQSQADKPARPAAKAGSQANQPNYSGKMQLPPSEENVDSTDAVPANPSAPAAQQAPVWIPQAGTVTRTPRPATGLRITSQPMGELAARAQALFAEQTDAQLMQGSVANLRATAIAPAQPPAGPSAIPAGTARYTTAQYTPSAQEAATGAYSAPKQQSTQQPADQPQQVQEPVKKVKPAPAPRAPKEPRAPKLSRRQRRAADAEAAGAVQQPAPPLSALPAAGPASQQVDINQLPAAQQAPSTTTTGLTDEELQQRNLPPLRGPWVRVQPDRRAINPRDEAEAQLRSIESSYSPWLGGTGVINYRSGDLGYDHLSALEAPFEASIPMGYNARLTFVAKPVFLDSGQADGTSVITVLEAISPGGPLVLKTIPQPIGTLSTTDTTPPSQQNASGIGGEVQLSFPHLAIAGGYTPAGFLVATVTGRAQWKPGNGPFTFNFLRDSVKDTQLSYAGLRDPAGDTLGNLGQIWGGVVANQGHLQFARGGAESGYYIAAGGQYLTGYKVASNTRIEGSGGAYWRLKTMPEYGNLSIGANFFGMHYAKNQAAFTYGMGGYFSPQAYFLANAPITWNGHSGTYWHYNILGSVGVQAFQVEKTALFPGSAITDYIPGKTSVGSNYDVRGQVAYQISPHWFAGGFFGANNSRNYSALSAGFYVRFLFRAQPSTVTSPTGLFPIEGQAHSPNDGMRPFLVP
jgi:hypothetical protein